MRKEQYKTEFLNQELTLKLLREIPQKDFKTKIDLVENYAEKVKDNYDADVFKVRLNNEIGFIYWDAKEYALSIKHYEKVIELLKPEDYPFLYFHVTALLIRCNRLLSYYEASLLRVKEALVNSSYADSFLKLTILNEYVDLLIDTNQPFDDSYRPIIQQIIDDLEFPQKLRNPIKTVKALREQNLIWNSKLSEITMKYRNDQLEQLKQFEEYREICEIGWYKNYVKNKIDELKKVS